MPKQRHKQPRQPHRPPLPPLGHYVLSFHAPDGSMHDPPIPLDQRLTDAELRELVDGVHAKLKARQAGEAAPGITINQADKLPRGIKLEDATASTVSPALAADTSGRSRTENPNGDSREATPGVEETESNPSPADVAAVRAEMNRLFEPDGKVRAPLNAPTATPGEKATSAASAPEPQEPVPVSPRSAGPRKPDSATLARDGWGGAAATLFYQGACMFTGACLLGAGVILGGWAALKALPWIAAALLG